VWAAGPALGEVALVVALTAVGALLRLATLGGDSLWFDEASMYHLVQGDWRSILALNATTSSGPPLFPLLLGALTGPDATEAALRAPAAVAGVLAIPLAWGVAREFAASPWALLAPLLVALSPVQVEYSQEVREYSLAFAAACAMVLAWARFLAAPDGRRAAWVAAAGTLGICVQYGNALLVAGLNLVTIGALALARAPWRDWRAWLAAQLPVAAAAAALFVTTIRPQLEVAVVAGGRYVYLAERYWDGTAAGLAALLFAPEADVVHFAFPGKVMLALVVAGAVALALRPGRRLALALLVVPGAVAFAAALAGAYPWGGIRQDMFLLAMVYATAAAGLEGLAGLAARAAGPWAAAGLGAVAVAALAWTGGTRVALLARSAGAEPMRPVAAELARRLDPGERVYVYWGAVPAFRYYWRGQAAPWTAGTTDVPGNGPGGGGDGEDPVTAELLAMMRDPAPFWLVISRMDADAAVALAARLREQGAVNVVSAANGSALLRVTPRGPGTADPP
jgi:hypothetical protein